MRDDPLARGRKVCYNVKRRFFRRGFQFGFFELGGLDCKCREKRVLESFC